MPITCRKVAGLGWAAAIVLFIILMVVIFKKDSEGFEGNLNVVDQPVISYYKTFTKEQYGPNAIVVGLHYTDWCGYCKLMKPVWNELKEELTKDPKYSGIVMIENDEQAKPTRGITGYPTIIRYRGGKAEKYKGRADYQQLRAFILSPTLGENFGAKW